MNKKPTAATSSSSSPATAINHRIIELQRKNAVYLHHSSRSALGMVFVRTNPCAPTNPVKIVENFPHLRGKFKIKLMKTMPLVGWLVGWMREEQIFTIVCSSRAMVRFYSREMILYRTILFGGCVFL